MRTTFPGGILLSLLLAGCGTGTQVGPDPSGRIEGTLLRRLAPATPGEPLAHATVSLVTSPCPPPGEVCTQGFWRPAGATTSDPNGRFSFQRLEPGLYLILSSAGPGAERLVTVSQNRTTDGTLVVTADTAVTGGTAGDGPVATIHVVTDRPIASVGDSVNIRAKLSNADGREVVGRVVEWTLTGPAAVFTFRSGPDAVLRIHAAGTATVTAASEGQSGSVSITVP